MDATSTSSARVARRPRVTVIVPAYNEAATLPELVQQIFTVPRMAGHAFDLIVVDDGSGDRTTEVAKGLATRYPVTVITLSRNFGKEAALLAGFDEAAGDAVITMDADLQDPVGLIDEFLSRWHEGYDCVYAVRVNRDDEGWLKRRLANVFYRLINLGAEVRIVPDALDFRLLDRKVVDSLLSLRERVRFTKGLFAWVGYPSIAALVGALVACGSVAYAAYIAMRTAVFGVEVPGWATLTVATMFLSGLQMLFLGVIGEYVRNIYLETKQRPNYLVRELVRSEVNDAVTTAAVSLSAPALTPGDRRSSPVVRRIASH